MWWTVQGAVTAGSVLALVGRRHPRRQRGDHDRHRVPAVPVRPADDPPAGGAGPPAGDDPEGERGDGARRRPAGRRSRRSSTRVAPRRRRAPLGIACRGVSFDYGDDDDRRSSTTSTSRSRAGRRSASSGARAAARPRSPGSCCASSRRRRARSSLGGVPIADIPMAELRRRVALVPQEVELFEGTIRDNVTLFDAGARDEDVVDALRRAGLDALVAGGIDRPLGARWRRAVGRRGPAAGPRPRLAAPARPRRARRGDGAHRSRSPSSAWTPPSAELMAGRTTLIIAHKLSTLRMVDEVIVFDHGRVVEHDDRDGARRARAAAATATCWSWRSKDGQRRRAMSRVATDAGRRRTSGGLAWRVSQHEPRSFWLGWARVRPVLHDARAHRLPAQPRLQRAVRRRHRRRLPLGARRRRVRDLADGVDALSARSPGPRRGSTCRRCCGPTC